MLEKQWLHYHARSCTENWKVGHCALRNVIKMHEWMKIFYMCIGRHSRIWVEKKNCVLIRSFLTTKFFWLISNTYLFLLYLSRWDCNFSMWSKNLTCTWKLAFQLCMVGNFISFYLVWKDICFDKKLIDVVVVGTHRHKFPRKGSEHILESVVRLLTTHKAIRMI